MKRHHFRRSLLRHQVRNSRMEDIEARFEQINAKIYGNQVALKEYITGFLENVPERLGPNSQTTASATGINPYPGVSELTGISTNSSDGQLIGIDVLSRCLGSKKQLSNSLQTLSSTFTPSLSYIVRRRFATVIIEPLQKGFSIPWTVPNPKSSPIVQRCMQPSKTLLHSLLPGSCMCQFAPPLPRNMAHA